MSVSNGGRRAVTVLGLAGALADPGEWVLVASGSTTFGGALQQVGADVMVLRLDNGDVAYVGLDAADEITRRPGS